MRKLCLSFAVALLAAGNSFAASLWVTEYQFNPTVTYQAVITPPVASQVVAISGASTQSAAFNNSTRLIRVSTDTDCSVEIGGTNPTATTTSAKMIAGQTEYFLVSPGDKLAVIANP